VVYIDPRIMAFTFYYCFENFLWCYSISVIQLIIITISFVNTDFLDCVHTMTFNTEMKNLKDVFNFPKGVSILQGALRSFYTVTIAFKGEKIICILRQFMYT
jgi:hypothetical protein